MDDIIRIVNSLDNLVILLDGISKTVNHEIKKKADFLVLW